MYNSLQCYTIVQLFIIFNFKIATFDCFFFSLIWIPNFMLNFIKLQIIILKFVVIFFCRLKFQNFDLISIIVWICSLSLTSDQHEVVKCMLTSLIQLTNHFYLLRSLSFSTVCCCSSKISTTFGEIQWVSAGHSSSTFDTFETLGTKLTNKVNYKD